MRSIRCAGVDCARIASLALGTTLCGVSGGLTAQAPATLPAGFAISAAFTEDARAAMVRAAIALPFDRHAVALGGVLELHGHGAAPRRLLSLGRGDDIAFVRADPAGNLVCGSLRTGDVHVLSAGSWHLQASFAGPRNSFAAVPLATSDLLLTANPLWPATGANSGLWLAGPGRSPRELLALQGPSGPLLQLANGDLIIAELGPIVPPPPGVARLLRVPAARIQAAIAGAALTFADVTAIGTGFAGIYALALDDTGRLHITDAQGGTVVHTDPAGLTPVGTTATLAPGMFALGLQFTNTGHGTFRSFQPATLAPRLHVGATDFTTRFQLLRIAPQRPRLTTSHPVLVGAGSTTIAIDDAPGNAAALVLGDLGTPQPEQAVAALFGLPLWLGLAPGNAQVLQTLPVSANGHTSFTFAYPGGFDLTVNLQAVVFDATAQIATTTFPLTLSLHP